METGKMTSSLADFIERAEMSQIPKVVVQKAKLLVSDFLGVSVAGSVEGPAKIIHEMIDDQGIKSGVTIIGTGLISHPTWASLANGISGHILDYDDVSQPMYGHPTVAVLSACLAVGEFLGANGMAILESYIIGLEVAVKLAYGMNPAHYEKGWHSTCTLGSMGATAAAAKLLGLKGQQLRSALAIGASQAGGLQLNFGTMTKSFHAGRAAENGVLAALLARKGWTGDQAILDSSRGFFRIFGGPDGEEHTRFLEKLGRPFDIEQPGIILKKYPSCAFSHPVVDAALEITRAPRYDPRDVDRVEGHIHALADQILIHHHPTTGLEAKFSMEACIAIALLDGKVNSKSFCDERVRRSDIQTMMTRIKRKVHTNKGDGPKGFGPATVRVYLRGGDILEARVEKAKGDPENPLDSHEIREKYMDCCSGVLPEGSIETSLSLLQGLERLENVRELMACFRVSQVSSR
ncbi:MAG: MmgE/PrpD family protein [Deltaproteobacteria bacterium]|nr:MmgE/PrpD family protein [Deltaproteobacteria bacterium]